MNTGTRGKFKVGALLSRTTVSAGGMTGATLATRLVGRRATGSPASGTFTAGDIVTTTDGSIYLCTVGGTPGTWVAGNASTTPSVTTLTVSGLSTLSGGVTETGPVILTPTAVAALALDVTLGPVYTKSIGADSTFTASAAGTAGQVIVLIITATGAQRVATMGTNLNSSGTLTIPSGKVGTISFISDATAFREIGRAING